MQQDNSGQGKRERAVKRPSHLLSMFLRDCSEVLASETAGKVGVQMSRLHSRSFPPFCKQVTKKLCQRLPAVTVTHRGGRLAETSWAVLFSAGMTTVWVWGVTSVCGHVIVLMAEQQPLDLPVKKVQPSLTAFSLLLAALLEYPLALASVHISSTFVDQGSKVEEVCWEASSLRVYVTK